MSSYDPSFVLVDASWSVADAVSLLEQLPAHYVVARSRGVGAAAPRYYVCLHALAMRLLQAGSQDNVGDAFTGSGLMPVPVVTPQALEAAASSLAVVAIDGRVLGVCRTVRSARDIDVEAVSTGHALVTDMPRKVSVGATESLLIHIAADASSPDAIPLTVAPGDVVELVVRIREPLVALDATEVSLRIPATGDSTTVRVRVQAQQTGWSDVTVHAFRGGQWIASATHGVEVVATSGRSRAARRRRMPLAARSREPDLSVLILEAAQGDSFTIRLSAAHPELGLNYRSYGPIRFRRDAAAFVASLFHDLQSAYATAAGDRAAAAQRLAAKGDYLFEQLLPPELQSELWRLRDRITSVQVQSEEPWIPWELCRLSGVENGRRVSGAFFFEQFAMTRWMIGVPQHLQLSLDQVAVVTPTDAGLPGAAREVQLLADMLPRVSRVPARFVELRQAMATGDFDAWHFAGHGLWHPDGADRASLALERGQRFTPEDIAGVVANLGVTHPVIVWNACHTGISGLSLTDIGGWARRFLSVSAGAFVGTYWAVDDAAASTFAIALYGELLGGAPFGEAARRARLRIKDRDASWLAYTVFAHPMATVSRGAPDRRVVPGAAREP